MHPFHEPRQHGLATVPAPGSSGWPWLSSSLLILLRPLISSSCARYNNSSRERSSSATFGFPVPCVLLLGVRLLHDDACSLSGQQSPRLGLLMRPVPVRFLNVLVLSLVFPTPDGICNPPTYTVRGIRCLIFEMPFSSAMELGILCCSCSHLSTSGTSTGRSHSRYKWRITYAILE